MNLGSQIIENVSNAFSVFSTMSMFKWISFIIEIILISVVIYGIIVWLKESRAVVLMRGIIVISILFGIAWLFDLNVIFTIMRNALYFVAIALIVIFQSDIRTGIEHIGRNNFLAKIMPGFEKFRIKTSNNIIQEIADAAFFMGRVKTGALIVIEQSDSLINIERTGIEIDGAVSRQLLINIFEKNTPLHDGAVLIVGNKIKAATCYLPLSNDPYISKDLGTRHRAALGISEVSDSITVVVSEETGHVSLCMRGKIKFINDEKELIQELMTTMDYDDKKQKDISLFGKMRAWFAND